jgi:hypothetical protein
MLLSVVALCLALVATLVAVGLGTPSDVVLEFNGHDVGGRTDRLIAGALAIGFGALGVAGILRGRARR